MALMNLWWSKAGTDTAKLIGLQAHHLPDLFWPKVSRYLAS